MKEIVFIIIGSVLTQSVQQVSKDENLRDKIQERKEIRAERKQQRLIKKIERLQKKVTNK